MVDFQQAGIRLIAIRAHKDYRKQRVVSVEQFLERWMNRHLEGITGDYKELVVAEFMGMTANE